ncbi:molybdate ABC transporter substrate-binding protein [Micromonospora globispora]|uniref:Molybdate ABC transporter substrate-binding protein n=1 Tax=Micromonospora globispora TaxID=1450148 RepID=A0A317K2W4_9ACTN|nr:molybdate ABC transporter substrate-binding protein [Micromonospora globispora]PWU49020.1 molybdate ABC transporter substrate-binding protein [Micromonospora globispora]RQX03915.1 molybdate ABC transporter substrate-binding protein [Micromonospora globispora]
MTVRWIRAALAAVAVLTLGLAGCGGEPAGSDGGRVTVFAAASLTESFTRLGKDFEAAHPGATVTFNFAGSSALATQITQGAPADVFAAASPATMKTVTDAGDAADTPVTLARNQLVIAVPKGNSARVAGLADLTRPGVKVALCAEQVPCGAAARKALDAAGARLTPATLEQDVKGALAKVKLGEVDAALVYRTDVRAAAADLDAVEFPESADAINDYPIVVLKRTGNPAGARAFVDFVRSEAGRAVLTAAGFQAPPA